MNNISIMYEEGRTVPTYLASPESGRHPGLIVIEEIWGVDGHIKDVCERFAREGFVVISPELLPEGVLKFATPEIRAALFDPEKRNEVQPKMREAMAPMMQPEFGKDAVEKLKACVDYLLADEKVDGSVGVLGFCFGGSYSFHLAINDQRIKAAVPFYGQPPELVDSVASIKCPVLNFNGANDANIIGKIPALEEAMKKGGVDYTSVIYPGAGHAFFNDTNPRSYNAEAAKDAWEKSLTFLHEHLA